MRDNTIRRTPHSAHSTNYDIFNQIVECLPALLRKDESFLANFSAEDTDFVRFNRNKIRQAGSVCQSYLELDLIEGKKHSSGSITLSGDNSAAKQQIAQLIEELREQRQHTPEDPHLLYSTQNNSSELMENNQLPDSHDLITIIQEAGKGMDMVGIYAAGGIFAGFANSFGQRNWYSNYSFNFNWSFYHEKDKAVKTAYAGTEWNKHAFKHKVDWAKQQLNNLSRPPCTLKPGQYRVYLSPTALDDFIGMLSWGGFSCKAQRTKQSTLMKLIEGEERLSENISIYENTADGIAPPFQPQGYLRPPKLSLIENGQPQDSLISPRSAQEFKIPTNGAEESETPQSIELSSGNIPQQEVLKHLDRGIYINNVWYLNYSDRNACRMTGMTRFATFWVEKGEIQAPLNVMRFDETIYNILGKNLIGLTTEREMILDNSTYSARSTASAHLPGALIEDFTLTL